MKKSICFVSLFIIAFGVNAQTEKGKLIITSGSDITMVFGNTKVEYDGNSIQERTVQQISFEPSIGVFTANNLAIGVTIPLDFEKIESDNITTEQSSYGIAPFMRLYFTNSKVKPYLIFDVGYLLIKNISHQEFDDTNDKYGGYIIDGGFGISAFINEHVAFDTQMSYGYSKVVYDGDTDLKQKANVIGLLIGLTITF